MQVTKMYHTFICHTYLTLNAVSKTGLKDILHKYRKSSRKRRKKKKFESSTSSEESEAESVEEVLVASGDEDEKPTR